MPFRCVRGIQAACVVAPESDSTRLGEMRRCLALDTAQKLGINRNPHPGSSCPPTCTLRPSALVKGAAGSSCPSGSGPPPLPALKPTGSDRRRWSWSSSREIDERQAALLHDGEDEHRLQRVLPEDQESAPPHARPGEPPDRPEAAPGERLRRLRAAGRSHQAPQEDQPPRRDTRDQGGRRRGRRRRRRPAAVLKGNESP